MKINKKFKFIKEHIESTNIKIISGQPGSGKSAFGSIIPNISNLKTIYLTSSLSKDIINLSKNPILNAFKLIPNVFKDDNIGKINFNNLESIQVGIINLRQNYISIIEEIIKSAKNLKEKVNLIVDELPLDRKYIIEITENKNLNLIFLTQDHISEFKDLYDISSFFAFYSFSNKIESNVLLENEIKKLKAGDFLFIENMNNHYNYTKYFSNEFFKIPYIDKVDISVIKFIIENFKILIEKNSITFDNEKYIIKILTQDNSDNITILKVIDKNLNNLNNFDLDLSIVELQDFFIKEHYSLDKEIYKVLRY
jgi:hypothetical protein